MTETDREPMKSFLSLVADDLMGRMSGDLSELTVVMPGRRARRFMSRLLARQHQGQPLWEPTYRTLDELFLELSPYTEASQLRSVCELYRVYRTAVPNPLPMDEFFGWGLTLLADFNDIDKHMADAERLLVNAADLERMANDDYLSERQRQALADFFHDFEAGKHTRLRERFHEMWDAMPTMYHGLRKALAEKGLMYRGALERLAVEGLGDEGAENGGVREARRPFSQGVTAFVGFNVLDEVEQRLFEIARDSGNALFYWDYDDHYVNDENQEAGIFLRDNLKRFPDALPLAPRGGLSDPKKRVTLVKTNSDNAQARYIPQWLEKKLTREEESQTAIVLADETLMDAAIHAIPSKGESELAPNALNVTMGYPLKATPVYGYYMALLDLQTFGFGASAGHPSLTAMEKVTSHPFYGGQELVQQKDNAATLRWLSHEMEALGTRLNRKETETSTFDQLYAEAVFQLFCLTNQLLELTEEGILAVGRTMMRRIARDAARGVSIPFHGEMDEGVQMMGLLETRNLDFRHVVMLSTEEGFMPKSSHAETSLIPYCLRESFHLDTRERRTAVFAYYFYRLLERADDVTLVYNETSDGIHQRERSRFIRQLETETSLNIRHIALETPLTVAQKRPIIQDKTPDVMERLVNRFDKLHDAKHDLSPTALADYLSCPLRFYFRHVLELNPPRDLSKGVDNILLGTLFHDAAELFYLHLTAMKGSHTIEAPDLKRAVDRAEKELRPYVSLAMWADYFRGVAYDAYLHGQERKQFLDPFLATASREELGDRVQLLYKPNDNGGEETVLSSLDVMVIDVVTQYLRQLLNCDMELTPFVLFALERPVHSTLDIQTTEGLRRIATGGRIDRLDIVTQDGQEVLRIVDYKTGLPRQTFPKSIGDIFNPEAKGQEHYYLQTLLYSMLMRSEQPLPVCPCLFYVTQSMDPKTYDARLRLGKNVVESLTDEMEQEYRNELENLVAEIFDPSVPFRQAVEKETACTFCDFKLLCGIYS